MTYGVVGNEDNQILYDYYSRKYFSLENGIRLPLIIYKFAKTINQPMISPFTVY